MEASILELATLTVVSVSALVVNHCYWKSPLFLIYANVLVLPVMIFIDELRFHKERLWVYVSLATSIGGIFACSELQFLLDEKVLRDSPDEGVRPWLHMAYAAAVLYCLPVYFTFVKPPRPHPAPRDLVLPLVVVLPFNVIVGISVLPGTFLDTVVRSRECRAAVMACCSQAALVCGTVAAAAAANRLDLVPAETTRNYLSILGAVTLLCFGPRFVWPELNTRRATRYAYMVLAAALPATHALHATGIVTLDSMECAAMVVALGVFFAGFQTRMPHIRAMLMISGRF